MWRETLKDFSVQEFQSAMSELVRNPPRYDPGDGELQVWRGMPKLPDVLDVMLDAREARVIEHRRRESERLTAEMRQLAKQREQHPEQFIGMSEVIQMAKEKGLL